jgi:hypothetical protein
MFVIGGRFKNDSDRIFADKYDFESHQWHLVANSSRMELLNPLVAVVSDCMFWVEWIICKMDIDSFFNTQWRLMRGGEKRNCRRPVNVDLVLCSTPKSLLLSEDIPGPKGACDTIRKLTNGA